MSISPTFFGKFLLKNYYGEYMDLMYYFWMHNINVTVMTRQTLRYASAPQVFWHTLLNVMG